MSVHGPADGWVLAPDGRKFWGKAGAAGLLVVDDLGPVPRVLLQHRVGWSHFGGTWGIPGGARQFDETPVEGALRESEEEAAVPPSALRLVFTSILDLGFWSYTTVVARVTTPFEPVISDGESEAIEWVALDAVDDLPLHPGFASSWPALREALSQPLHLVVDAANVIGSRPHGWLDGGAGWWTDRARATDRLLASLDALAASGVSAEPFGGSVTELWWPDVSVVVEGEGRGAQDPAADSRIALHRAPADGDSAIVECVAVLTGRAAASLPGVAAASGALPPAAARPAAFDAVPAAPASASASAAAAAAAPSAAAAPAAAPSAAGAARVVVVTADRELSVRVEALGASVVGPATLLSLLDL